MTTVFDNASSISRADDRFVLEEDGEGRLYETSNANTQCLVCGAMVGTRYPDRDGLIEQFGGSEELADRYLSALRDEDK